MCLEYAWKKNIRDKVLEVNVAKNYFPWREGLKNAKLLRKFISETVDVGNV